MWVFLVCIKIHLGFLPLWFSWGKYLIKKKIDSSVTQDTSTATSFPSTPRSSAPYFPSLPDPLSLHFLFRKNKKWKAGLQEMTAKLDTVRQGKTIILAWQCKTIRGKEPQEQAKESDNAPTVRHFTKAACLES